MQFTRKDIKMLPLNLPQYETKIIKRNGKLSVFDDLRRCYVALTPEEWVRQNFVHYLIEQYGYPAALMANEVSLTLNGTKRRCDTVVYDHSLKPLMIIEYKAPTVKIDKAVFEQIYRYNLVMRVEYLVVSNGIKHFCCRINYTENSFNFLTEIPCFQDITK